MSRKRPGAFRNMFGQPGLSDLLDVPGEAAPPPPRALRPPPEATPAPQSASAPEPPAPEPDPEPPVQENSSNPVPDPAPVAADLPDFDAPPPPLSLSEEPEDAPDEVPDEEPAEPPQRGITDVPTELLPRGELVAADLTELLEPPTSPLLAQRAAPPPRPPPRTQKPARPRPPGAPRGVGPAEKGEKLLARVRAGEPIHDDAFFDAALPGAMLLGADLSCGQLQRVNLSSADLRFADLRESDLRGADLSGADLRGADLRGCRLDLARLEDSDLRGARLSGLDLTTTGSLHGADLRGADLSDVELSAAIAGARIDHSTHAISRWSPRQLAEALRLGAILDDPALLPRHDRLEALGAEEGLVLGFTTALSFQDRFVLAGLICAILGPDSECRMAPLSGDRLLLETDAADLDDIAEALSSRLWEREPHDDAERALSSQLGRVLASDSLLNELSSLVDRIDSITLHAPDGDRHWRPLTDPLDALGHLLLKLFIPVELRWWLAVLPGGKQLVRSLPERDAAPEAVVAAVLEGLEGLGRIDAALFASLIEERRRREAEIRAVAALWAVDLQ
jgi:hypothetical protein